MGHWVGNNSVPFYYPALSLLPELSANHKLLRMMKIKAIGSGIALKQIAELIGAEVIGSKDSLVTCVCSVESPVQGAIAFSTEQGERRLIEQLPASPLVALVIDSKVNTAVLPQHITYLKVARPFASFIDLIPLFYENYERPAGISPLASVHPSATIGADVSIDAFVSIGAGCKIGDGCTIYSHVVLYPEVTLGENVVLHAGAIVRERCILGNDIIVQNGAVIGGDGFGYIPDAKVGIRSVPQVGQVQLADKVEIGVNTCVDRGAFGDTTLGYNTKIDNLVQIGHNVSIGQYSIVCGQTAIAGSVKIGNQVTIGGGSTVAGHLEICDSARLAGHSSFTHTVRVPGDYGGFPTQPVMKWRRQTAALRKLPALIAELRKSGLIKKQQLAEDD